jgi:7,8-dihydropterin-6-yl-methyl-4-(beta-D-ribofuranosyl)aminobenzene 5'-phosphate synthase
MGMTILTLAENAVQKLGLIAEHGLSFLIASSGGDILFDTGQGLALIPNAMRMGVDLRRISSVVLSHGHIDHTGGLPRLVGEIGPRPLFAHPSAFSRKYSKKTGELRSIGAPKSREGLERSGVQLRPCMEPVEAAPGILATGAVPRMTDFEQIPRHFLKDSPDGSGLVQDLLEDDQALILQQRGAPVVVLGCGHSGIVNTLLYAAELTGTKRFSLVVGGTHLIDADDARLERTLESLRQFDIRRIAPCHCTGPRGQFALWERYGSAFLANATGDRIECGE